MKEEIDHLKKGLEQGSGGDQTDLHELILNKERDLELLIRVLDDKLRFGQKAIERVGSGAGRTTASSDRPTSSQSESSRSSEFFERPRSRDDRRSFQRGREGGFLGNRDMDRYLLLLYICCYSFRCLCLFICNAIGTMNA